MEERLDPRSDAIKAWRGAFYVLHLDIFAFAIVSTFKLLLRDSAYVRRHMRECLF